jgi:lambda family phage portal protein
LAKQTKTKRAVKRRDASEPLREEVQLRRLVAKVQIAQAKAALASYTGAERGRRNRDWKAPIDSSADLAIINDTELLNARAREMDRNNWIIRAAKRARVRNVAGKGIMPIPAAKDAEGRELKNVNDAATKAFMRWASSHQYCDVERRQTFWQKQRMNVSEKLLVGQHFTVWSYEPNPHVCGIRLQSFEPEQLNKGVLSYEGREVRRGIELDQYGAPVAYHFVTRHQSDYLAKSRESIRIPAERVLHYYDTDRVLQTHGVTELAPIMQETRDFGQFKEATMWRAKLEAYIGLIIKSNAPGGLGTGFGRTAPPRAGDSGTTSGGMTVSDFVPGMVAHLREGEDVSTVVPTTPGSQYVPFKDASLEGIGAGLGLSFGALTRKNNANFSAARQDMLEDEREFGPEQDILIDRFVMPVYELVFAFSVFEGRIPLDTDAYLENPDQYREAEYIVPERPWIDPEKEANAAKIMLEQRLVTRAEIRAGMGGVWRQTLRQIKEEKVDAETEGVGLPENSTNGIADPKVQEMSESLNAYGVGVRAGIITPQVVDEEEARKRLGLPAMGVEIEADWEKSGGIRKPITIQPPADSSAPAFGHAAESEPLPAQDASLRRVPLSVFDAPEYRPSKDENIDCGSCRFFIKDQCEAYDFAADHSFVCKTYEPCPPIPANPTDGRRKIEAPQRPDGEAPIDDVNGSFLSHEVRGVS